MKMNNQSRNFARQAQTDLLALCDADLFHVVHQWVDRGNASEVVSNISDATYLALGYTSVLPVTNALQYLHDNVLQETVHMPTFWQAPSPSHLRTLLIAMDVDVFVQHVIALAYQALHTIYPQWYEGAIFNAHLANHLRQISMNRKTTNKEQSVSI
jgi:hypothetical protein